MLKNAISVIILGASFYFATLLLQTLDISYTSLVSSSKYIGGGSTKEDVSVSDGGVARVSCLTTGLDKAIKMRCLTKVDTDYLVKIDLVEEETDIEWRQVLEFQLVPRLADLTRKEAVEKGLILSASESGTRSFPIVSVTPGIWDRYTQSKYDVGAEAVKALIASDIRKAAQIYERELSRVDIERISELNASIISENIGTFTLRKNLLKMILQGKMEYIILSLSIGAVLLLFWGTSLIYIFGSPKAGMTTISQSSSLGVSLTYLGLLGTLIGMFGTVAELSAIDFVDEMKKVFDQTSSFGSMALAIGTSVVGLTGSVAVLLLHTALGVVTGRRL